MWDELRSVRRYETRVLPHSHPCRLIAHDPAAEDGMDAAETRQVEYLLAHESFGAVATVRPCQPPLAVTSSTFAPSRE
jgi:hypothetical protein